MMMDAPSIAAYHQAASVSKPGPAKPEESGQDIDVLDLINPKPRRFTRRQVKKMIRIGLIPTIGGRKARRMAARGY